MRTQQHLIYSICSRDHSLDLTYIHYNNWKRKKEILKPHFIHLYISKPTASPNQSWDARSQVVGVGDKIIGTAQKLIQIVFAFFCTTVRNLPVTLDQAVGEFTHGMNFNLKKRQIEVEKKEPYIIPNNETRIWAHTDEAASLSSPCRLCVGTRRLSSHDIRWMESTCQWSQLTYRHLESQNVPPALHLARQSTRCSRRPFPCSTLASSARTPPSSSSLKEQETLGFGHVSYAGVPEPFTQCKSLESCWHKLPQILQALKNIAVVETISDSETRSHQ